MKRAIFNRFAGYYDVGVGGLARWCAHCLSVAEHLPADARRVLDLGTGPGVSAFELAAGAPHAHVVGVDFAPRMLRPGVRMIFLEPRAEAPVTPGLRTWLRETHFAWIMTQWHCFGRWEGRFTATALCDELEGAGLRVLLCTPRLDGFGWLGVAEKPTGDEA